MRTFKNLEEILENLELVLKKRVATLKKFGKSFFNRCSYKENFGKSQNKSVLSFLLIRS